MRKQRWDLRPRDLICFTVCSVKLKEEFEMNSKQAISKPFSFEVKVIIEPRSMTWEAPKQPTGLGFLGGLISEGTENKSGSGIQLNTVSEEVFGLSINPDSNENLDVEIVRNLTLHKDLLYQFREVFADPAVEAGVQEFIKAKDRFYAQKQKKGRLSHSDLLEIEREMSPFNLGYVLRVQMMITIKSEQQFTGASQGRDGLYRLVRKSKQAYMSSGQVNPSQLLVEIKDRYNTELGKVQSESGNVNYQIVSETREDGSVFRRLTSIGASVFTSND